MEWLEFSRWSPEVQQRLALQAARLSLAAQRSPSPASAESASARAHRLEVLLRECSPTNPWGHPAAEC
jgi:hypothetical protein